uniref:Uncharacterized protein n=1 Tax=Anguilla anguilla TaxID=7936 RepID=A0A0E9SPH0_ANGAN
MYYRGEGDKTKAGVPNRHWGGALLHPPKRGEPAPATMHSSGHTSAPPSFPPEGMGQR